MISLNLAQSSSTGSNERNVKGTRKGPSKRNNAANKNNKREQNNRSNNKYARRNSSPKQKNTLSNKKSTKEFKDEALLDELEKKRKRLIYQFQQKVKEMRRKFDKKEILKQEYCDEIMGMCVATNNWDEVLNILDIMKANQLEQQQSTYRMCLDQCHLVANVDSAVSILGAMEQANIRPEGQDLGMVVATLCKRGNWRRAMHLVKQSAEKNGKYLSEKNENQAQSTTERNKFIIPIIDYNAILSLMAKTKHWKEALQFLSLMEKNSPDNLHPKPYLSTYNIILEACNYASQPDQSMQILHTMLSPRINVVPDTHSYNLAIAACLKKQQWRRAIKILTMMSEADPPVPQTTVTYNSVISCCAKAGEVQRAMSLLKIMRSRNVKPDTVTYNAVMSACAKSYKTWKDALTLLDELNREPGVNPDIVTYTIAIRACSKGGKTQRGLAMFQMMKDRNLKLDVYVYTGIIDLCAKAGLWKQSLDLLDEMRSKGISPNGFTYSVAISACGKGGQWERSLELLYQMKERGIHVNTITYNAAIGALANASSKNMRQALKEERSKKYLDRVLENGDSTFMGNGLSTIQSYGQFQSDENQLWRKALNLIDQMKENGVKPDAITYSSAIKVCGAAGQWEEALKLINIMQKGGPKTRPNRISYTNAITACGISGEHEHALRLFNDMKNDGVQPDRVSYNALISALKIGNQAEQVYNVWNEMCGRTNTSDRSDDVIATAAPDVRKIAPDIITVTDVLSTLERSSGWREKSDIVFEEAVNRKILFKPTLYSLDTVWEVDLSGLSFPVAHAAIRFALKRATQMYSEKGELDDLTFITGVGSGQNHRIQNKYNDEDGMVPNNEGRAPIALREFIRDSLNNEFEPKMLAVVPKYALGTVVIGKDFLQKWMDHNMDI